MTKGIIFSLLLIGSGFLSAQTKTSDQTFTTKLKGNLRGLKGDKVYLHHKWDNKDYTDSVRAQGGSFVFTIKTPEPNMYWLNTSPDVNAQPSCIFFVDKAPVTLNAHADSLAFAVAQGGQAQNDYIEYRQMINGFVQTQMRMQNDYNEAAQKGDMATQEAIRNEYGNLNNQYLAGLKGFVKSHPKSPVSGYIVYSDYNNPNIPISELEEALSGIDKSMAGSKFVKLANKRVADMRGTTVGYPATDFSQNTPEGRKVNLSDFRGKVVLVDFWASWCRPCRMENPNVVAAYNRFKDKGFTVLGVSLDQNKEPWMAAIKQDQLTWTHVSDLKGWGNEVGKLYGVTGIPQNFLIDKEGKIVAKDLRGPALEEKLAEVLK
jgi:peroxiredoxin